VEGAPARGHSSVTSTATFGFGSGYSASSSGPYLARKSSTIRATVPGSVIGLAIVLYLACPLARRIAGVLSTFLYHCLSQRPNPGGQPSPPAAQRRTALPMLRTSDSRFLLFFLCFMSMRRISARVSLTGDLARVSSIFRLSVSSRSAFAAAACCEAALRRSYFAHLFVSRVFHIPGTHSLHRHTKDPDITVGEFQELAEMLLTDRDKGSLLLIAARRGAVVPVVWHVTS
jgi:hypothetical protein